MARINYTFLAIAAVLALAACSATPEPALRGAVGTVNNANCTNKQSWFSCENKCRSTYGSGDVHWACSDGCSIRCEQNDDDDNHHHDRNMCVTSSLCEARCHKEETYKHTSSPAAYIAACVKGCALRC